MALVLLAGLSTVPPEIEEAAQLETKSHWTVLRHVQLPFLIPSLVAVLILRTADTLKLFDMPFTMTRGGPGSATEFIAILIERVGNRQFDIGMASAQSIIMLVDHHRARPPLHPPVLPGGPLMAASTARGRGACAIEALLLSLICLFCVFPFYWMVTTSLKTQVVALQSPPVWLFTPTLANYWEVLFVDKVGPALINSIIVAVCTTVAGRRPRHARPPTRWRGSSFAARRTSGSGSSPTASSARWCWPSRSS